MTDVFASIPGAVVDETGLRHLGSPLAEQKRLAAGEAVAPLGERAVIAVPGEDRLTWLDSLSSQALARLEPGVSTEMLVLDPQGHVEHAASVIDDGETTWLIADRDDAAGLLDWLRRMRFRLRVDPRIADDEYAVIGGAPAALAAITAAAPAGVPLVWTDPWPDVSAGGHAYAAVDPHPGCDRAWAEAIVTRDEARRVADAATAGEIALAGQVAADALRVAAWRPRWADVDERALPHELDWLRTAVHLSKGCYRGQETVARVFNLGKPPRRIVMLHLDGSDHTVPEPGEAVLAGGREVGRLTSVARHHELGPVGLAVVKRSLDPEAELVVGGIAARQEIIVGADGVGTGRPDAIDRSGLRRR